jgi:hypothetical protein
VRRRRGAGVAAGDCVDVSVECGRHAVVIEPTGNDHDRDAGVEPFNDLSQASSSGATVCLLVDGFNQ